MMQRQITTLLLLLGLTSSVFAVDGWLQIDGVDGPGEGKNIVLIAGDEEYRTEETMPMLAQLLAKRHGFDCTVVFSMSPDGTYIDPNNGSSMEGVEALKFADLMIIGTRFRHPSEAAMKYVDEYIQKGKPIIGLRTATHAFQGVKGNFAHYNNSNANDPWKGGFGRAVLGEKWISHHGQHGSQSTRGIVADGAEDHPILKGVKPNEIWGPTDVYGVRLPLPGDSKALVLGAVLEGMNPDDAPIKGAKNDPMMPVIWTKTYESSAGKVGRVMATTMGASQDFVEPGLRRVVVNSVYWALGMEDKIKPDLNIDVVGEFNPSPFGFRPPAKYPDFWKNKALVPAGFVVD